VDIDARPLFRDAGPWQTGRYRIAGGSWGQQHVRQIYTSSFSATLQSGQGLQGKTLILEATYGV
jgi:hypothetical protein